MALFSRSFVRKRAISFMTTALVGVFSLALARGPHHLRTAPVAYVSDPYANEAAFLTRSDTAMSRMTADLSAKPNGDIDRDFVAIMVPHHQAAIEMAQAELRYGRNEQLRELAQDIVTTRQQEIAAMRLAIGVATPLSAASPTQPVATPVSGSQAAADIGRDWICHDPNARDAMIVK